MRGQFGLRKKLEHQIYSSENCGGVTGVGQRVMTLRRGGDSDNTGIIGLKSLLPFQNAN